MTIFLKTILAFFILNPELTLNWVTHDDDSRLRASLNGYQEELSNCLSSGLTVRYRFEFELCRKRKYWFDACRDKRIATSAVEYDPISETYAITSDLLGDSEPPQVERTIDIPKAMQFASSRSDITLSWLASGSEHRIDPTKQAFRGRVYAECRGEYSESMKRLSYILSLGLVKSAGYDSGWVEFRR